MSTARCRSCGGSRAHHTGDTACWCPKCLALEEAERCTAFAEGASMPPPPPPVDRNVVRVGKDHPDTAKAAAAKAHPKSGTIRRAIYDVVAEKGATGATDDEMEKALRRSHQSVSGSRNSLVRDGHLRDSGLRRKNSYGNDAIVWVVADPSEQKVIATPLPLVELAEKAQGAAQEGMVREVGAGYVVLRGKGAVVTIPEDHEQPVTAVVNGITLSGFPEDRDDLSAEAAAGFTEPEEVAEEVLTFFRSAVGLSD